MHGDGSWSGWSYFIAFGCIHVKEWTSLNFRFSLTKVSYRLTIWESSQGYGWFVSTVLEESSEERTIVECFHHAVWMARWKLLAYSSAFLFAWYASTRVATRPQGPRFLRKMLGVKRFEWNIILIAFSSQWSCAWRVWAIVSWTTRLKPERLRSLACLSLMVAVWLEWRVFNTRLSVLRFLPSKGLEACSICSVKNSSIRSSPLRDNKRQQRLVDAAKERP